MDRSLIIPLSIAAALHAGVLFGFKRGVVPAVAHVKSTWIEIHAPPPVEDPPEEEKTSEQKDPTLSAALVPRSVEPVTPPDPTRMEIPPVPAVDADPRLKDLKNVDFRPINVSRSDGNVFDPTMLDNTPRARVQIAPPYPFDAKHSGLSGKVLVEFIVDETGHVLNPHIVESTNAAFDETTLRTIVKWRFEPGKKNGRAVRFRMALPLEFNLNDN